MNPKESEVGNSKMKSPRGSEAGKGRTSCQRRVRPVIEGDGWQRMERLAKEELVVKGGSGQQRRVTVGKGERGWQRRERLAIERLAMARLAKKRSLEERLAIEIIWAKAKCFNKKGSLNLNEALI